MRFTLCIQQNISRLYVSMQDAVFMRVVHGACHLCGEFHRLPDGHRRVFNHFVELSAFDELHAEVALPITLTYLVDWDDAWMVKARCGLSFQTKTL
jgi:hypothetical protein